MLGLRPVPAEDWSASLESLPASPFRIALAGAGRVGTAVAALLQSAGHNVVAVSSRISQSAEVAAARLGAPVVETSALPDVDVVLLGTPQGSLAEVTASLPPVGSVLVHFAGAIGTSSLRDGAANRALCALHPVQACPDVDTALRRLPGSAWGVTCSRGVRSWAHRVIEQDLHGRPFDVAEEDRVLWHAAAVTTSNGIAALLAVGESLLARIGVERPEEVLGPIALGTVMNAGEGGGGGRTLTGPVIRKETDLIGLHIAQIADRAPDLLPSYRQALHMIVDSALAAGRIDGDDETLLRQTLGAR